MTPTALVVGDSLLDVAIQQDEPMRPGGDVPARVRVSPGGQGANVAVRLARRGVEVTLVCGLGHDAAGRLLREQLESEGISLHAVRTEATGSVAILLGPGSERTMLSQRSPFVERPGMAAVRRLADGADWLVLSGYMLPEVAATPLLAPARRPRARRVVLGRSLASGETVAWLDALRNVAPDVLVLNLDEARLLLGRDPKLRVSRTATAAEDDQPPTTSPGAENLGKSTGPRGRSRGSAATALRNSHGATFRQEPHAPLTRTQPLAALPEISEQLAAATGSLVVVTEHGAAAAATTQASALLVEAEQSSAAAVDSTGAGDAFAAALIAELALGGGWPPERDALKRALAAGLVAGTEVAAVHGAQARVASEGAKERPAAPRSGGRP